jgi:hypothetical protein
MELHGVGRTPSLASMNLLSRFLFAVLFLTVTGCALADDPRDADVDKDMAKLKAAMIGKDQAGLIDMMYKPIVEAAGGRDHLLAQAQQVASIVEMKSFEYTKPFQYYSGKDNDYVVVHTHLLMSLKGKSYESISYELGVKSHQGGPWQYADGAGINAQTRPMFFADLPSDVVLPDHSIKPAN